MEPHTNLKLLFLALSLIISVNAARLAPDGSPVPQPVSSPFPSPSQSPSASPTPSPSPSPDFSSETIELTISPSEEPNSDAEPEPEPEETETSSNNGFGINFGSDLHAVAVNPEVKKICDQTDHSSLCLATVLPLIKNKPSVNSILQVAVQASSVLAKQALSVAKKMANKPGTPDELKTTLKDCQDGYDTAVENFQKTLDAFATNDVGTMRTMLSAVITFVGDCQDSFQEMQVDSPLTAYSEKLTEMTSNCLAISSLMSS